ncbi:unnamed protein product [Heligmosomoides polygyrus]|uniref:CAP-Gly domain-containing protein n=1 Tax=Heligmosomoides polygyrus TaxID=6339 RepID=A0A3P8E5V0_HELPZ|nr:unnamed protein product [Heligmosomoides polygyrus]
MQRSIAAESFVYVHPVNPKLHPKEMFPIQRGTKGFGKVRDLPPSGIVYLDRIKPIGDDFRGSALARANNTFVIGEAAIPLPEPKTDIEKVLDSDIEESRKAAALPMDFDSDLKTPPSPFTSTSRPTNTAKLMLRHKISLGRRAPQHEGSTLLKPKKNEQKSATVKVVKRPENEELSDDAERHLEQLLSELKAQEEVRDVR